MMRTVARTYNGGLKAWPPARSSGRVSGQGKGANPHEVVRNLAVYTIQLVRVRYLFDTLQF